MNDFEKQIHAMFDHIWDCDINHSIFDDTVGELMNAVIQCYNNLPSAEPQWIPVSERLPETSDEVLTTYIVNGNHKKRFVETSTYYDGDEGYWSSPWDEYRIFGTKVDVIAWMPLPEPYKGGVE